MSVDDRNDSFIHSASHLSLGGKSILSSKAAPSVNALLCACFANAFTI